MKIGRDILISKSRSGGKTGDITYYIGIKPSGSIWKSHGKKWKMYRVIDENENLKWLTKFLNHNAKMTYEMNTAGTDVFKTSDSLVNETFKQLVKLKDERLKTITQAIKPTADLIEIRKIVSAMEKI